MHMLFSLGITEQNTVRRPCQQLELQASRTLSSVADEPNCIVRSESALTFSSGSSYILQLK